MDVFFHAGGRGTSFQLREKNRETQIWIDAFQYHFLSTKTEYFNDIGVRFTLPYSEWTRIYARPSISHRFQYWLDGLGGVGVFYTFQDSISDQLEVRPWQGVKLRVPKLGSLRMVHYIRFEQRFVWTLDGSKVEFSPRIRYRLGTRIPIGREKIEDKSFYVNVDGEVFLNFGTDVEERVADRMRFRGGIGYQLTKFYRFELNSTLQLGRNTQTNGFEASVLIIQLKFVRRIFTTDN